MLKNQNKSKIKAKTCRVASMCLNFFNKSLRSIYPCKLWKPWKPWRRRTLTWIAALIYFATCRWQMWMLLTRIVSWHWIICMPPTNPCIATRELLPRRLEKANKTNGCRTPHKWPKAGHVEQQLQIQVRSYTAYNARNLATLEGFHLIVMSSSPPMELLGQVTERALSSRIR